MKRIFSVFIAVVLLISILPAKQVSAVGFTDVPASHGFYQEIMFLLDKGVVNSVTKFGVNDKVTREEVAIMVSKAIGLNGAKTATKFKDVPATSNASGYINSAVKAGVLSGYTDGTFRPKQYVNRGQMAIFLANAFKLQTESSSNFKDVKPSMASFSAIKKIVQAKITTGYSDKTFRPNDTLTRGQISAFLARAMGFKKSIAKDMKVHFIDVGQGDSIFIQSPNGKTMLIDGGTKSDGDTVVAYLKSLKVSKLDYIVATHPDADHIGGLIDVVNNFTVGQFINSGKVHTTQTYEELLSIVFAKNIDYSEPKTGDSIGLDSALRLQVLHVDASAADNNDASIVLKATYNKVSFLLTGDADTDIESKIMAKYDVKATVLKAGHHGSNTSSSAKFISAVKPATTILSYGKDNSYGHPHKEVVTRLQNVGSNIYSTAVSGNVVVSTNGLTHSVSAKPWVGEGTGAVTPAPKPITQKPDLASGLYVIPGAPTSYANCTAMRVYYPDGVKKGHIAYAATHDRDNDNWACEK